MRILFLAPHPFFAERGTPIAVRQAVTVLCEHGHEIDLLTYHEGEDIEIPGARLIRIRPGPGIRNVPIGFSLRKLVCDAWMALAAFRLVRRHDYDVVHAVEEAVFIGLMCRTLRRFKLVYDMDSLMPDQIAEKWPWARSLLPPLRWFEGQAIRRSDLVLAVCQAVADRAASTTAPSRVHLLPDMAFDGEGTETGEIEALRGLFRAEAPLALYVGNLEHYQGIDLMLEAVAQLPPEKPCNLVVIGGGEGATRHYSEKASEMRIGERVRFLGHRPLSMLGHYLEQADILCSPRLRGVNTPMKIYSYMASGRAVLATDIPSHSQILDPGCALLAPATPSAFATGLARLLDDPELRETLGSSAAAKAARLYSAAAFADRLTRAYATIAGPEAVQDEMCPCPPTG